MPTSRNTTAQNDILSPSVSVLVPVYNVEKYLRQCLDSLVAQTLGEIEFICLNDGSTDGSLAILREYAQRDKRFRVIDKPNSGYGATMNEGLRQARGRYIGILESDDWAEPDCFEKLYAAAREAGWCDVAKGNYFKFHESSEHPDHPAHPAHLEENYPRNMCGRRLTPAGEELATLVLSTPAIWSAIYRRDFLERFSIGFAETPGASYQDTGFVLKCWCAAESVTLVHDGVLHYRYCREGSSTSSRGKVFAVCGELDSTDEFARGLPDADPELLEMLAAKRFATYRWNLSRLDGPGKREFALAAADDLRRIREETGWDGRYLAPKDARALARWTADPDGYLLDLQIAAARKAGNSALTLRLRRKLRNTLRSAPRG